MTLVRGVAVLVASNVFIMIKGLGDYGALEKENNYIVDLLKRFCSFNHNRTLLFSDFYLY